MGRIVNVKGDTVNNSGWWVTLDNGSSKHCSGGGAYHRLISWTEDCIVFETSATPDFSGNKARTHRWYPDGTLE